MDRSTDLTALMACADLRNPFLRMLVSALHARLPAGRLAWDLDAFRDRSAAADIVHVQWPEGLLGWDPPTSERVRELEAALDAWRERAALCVTVHNLRPHYRTSSEYLRLYDAVYSRADALIHLGRASVPLLVERYPRLADVPHEVIPHGPYTCFADTISRDAARQRLGVLPDRFLVLCFGVMRHVEETRFVARAARKHRGADRTVMIAGRLSGGGRRVPGLVHRLYAASQPSLRVEHGHIPDDEVQVFLNAADVLVIPRLHALNSGNVALGFTFGRVVVGPDTGVIGELLRDTGNPTFDPRDHRSLTSALERARDLCAAGRGEENRAYARRHWAWDDIAAAHLAFYRRVVRDRGTAPAGGAGHE